MALPWQLVPASMSIEETAMWCAMVARRVGDTFTLLFAEFCLGVVGTWGRAKVRCLCCNFRQTPPHRRPLRIFGQPFPMPLSPLSLPARWTKPRFFSRGRDFDDHMRTCHRPVRCKCGDILDTPHANHTCRVPMTDYCVQCACGATVARSTYYDHANYCPVTRIQLPVTAPAVLRHARRTLKPVNGD